MVSTRRHPDNFPPPDLTPSRGSNSTVRMARSSSRGWKHRPSNLTLIWLVISLPLVIWDTTYVFLRPHSMPGGWLHSPIWKMYGLYGTVDHIYGWKAYNSHNGFTAAQSAMNVVETGMYAWYLGTVYAYGQQSARQGRGAPRTSSVGWLGESRSLGGRRAGEAVLIAFAAAVMTLSKTLLYCRSGRVEARKAA